MAKSRIRAATALVTSVLAAGSITTYALTGTSASGSSTSATAATRDPEPPPGFRERNARVNGIRVHYVIGGQGPTLVLLHGYPQTSYEWYGVMPKLASQYRVIAPDLRGAGGSSAPADGYDKATMAQDLRALLISLGRQDNVRIVGHDIGTMVAFAYADAYRSSVATGSQRGPAAG